MANKKAVLGRPTPDASLPRNAFDRESMREFHYALGQLVPGWWEAFTAGSHVKLNRKIFQRTSQLNTASFPILDTHVQYYFVPFRLLWSLWDDFRLGIKDVNSTALVNSADETSLGSITMPSRVPYTTIQDILTQTGNMVSNSQTDIFGFPTAPQAYKLLNLLGYGMPNAMSPSQVGDVNLWPILAYHKIYYDHFRNTQYETNCAKAYNMDYLWARNRDMKLPSSELYLNYQGLLTMHYVNYRNDYFTNLYPSLNYISSTPVNQGSAGVPGSFVANPLGLPSNVPLLTSGNLSTSDMGVVNAGQGRGIYLGHYPTAGNPTNLTLSSIRAAFALDKLQRSSAYAGQHVKDQHQKNH